LAFNDGDTKIPELGRDVHLGPDGAKCPVAVDAGGLGVPGHGEGLVGLGFEPDGEHHLRLVALSLAVLHVVPHYHYGASVLSSVLSNQARGLVSFSEKSPRSENMVGTWYGSACIATGFMAIETGGCGMISMGGFGCGGDSCTATERRGQKMR